MNLSERLETSDQRYGKYRWAMMLFLVLGTSAQGLTYMNSPPMVLPVSKELGLSAVQVAVWVNIAFLMSTALSIPAGLLADRFDVKRFAEMGLLLMGTLALMRGFSGGFATLMLTSTLAGVGWVIFFTSIPVITKAWFPSREIGTAMGVIFAGYGVGAAAGVALSNPLFGSDWRRCFLVLGIWGVLAAMLWWAGARRSPKGGAVSSPLEIRPGGSSFRSHLRETLKIKTVWILALTFFFYIGSRTTWLTFSYSFLVTVRSWPESVTGAVLLFDWVGYVTGAFLVALISDRLGLRKPFFLGFGVLLGGLFLLLPSLSSPISVSILTFFMGVSFGAINPLIFVVCAESEDIRPELTGSATGVIISFANLGVLVIPTAAGNLLGSLDMATMTDYRWVWLLVAVSLFVMAGHAMVLRESGARVRAGLSH